MSVTNLLLCEKCGKTALVVQKEQLLCVECLMAQVAQSRDRTMVMRDTKPIRFDELNGEHVAPTQPLFR